MDTITLNIPEHEHSYSISIGAGTLRDVASLFSVRKYSKVFVVTDQNLETLWLDKLLRALPIAHAHIVLPPGEQAKSINNIESIWSAMHDAACDRKTLVITLGGGVIGDMGGFAASTYMRGVAFAHIPTTLLAQVDSSIGGKTGVDFRGVKNLIGTFAQPTAVLIDTNILTTLPRRELLAGFAEMIKHALIKDKKYLEQLTKKPLQSFTSLEIARLVIASCRIKTAVVQGDETETGERKVLNFGHTIGHAIESLSLDTSRPLLHGEAVSIGMVAEAELSQSKGYITSQEASRIKEILHVAGLPTSIPSFPVEAIMEKLRSDKKNEYGSVYFTLLRHIGDAAYNQDISEMIIRRTIRRNLVNG